MQAFWQDMRYGMRMLARSPGFSALAVLALGLGIGASTAIFSVIENGLLNPFPYADAKRLVVVQIHNTDDSVPGGRVSFSPAEFGDYSRQNHVFDWTIGSTFDDVLYKTSEGTEQFRGTFVTPNTFEALGVPAMLGRGIEMADGAAGAPPVFVMRHKLWKAQFNSDPGILNKTFVLNGTSCTLVGIMPPRFAWENADVWIPHSITPEDFTASYPPLHTWFLLGHLKPGVKMREAQADLTVVAKQMSGVYPKQYPSRFTVQVMTLADYEVGDFRTTLFIVLAAVGLLLLIGCANVANLLLARATVREKEFAIRAALGASRARIVRQLLAESALLAIGGGGLGALLAWAGLKVMVRLIPEFVLPLEAVIQLNAPVLVFAIGVTAMTVLIFELVPALQVSRRDLNDPLRDSGKGLSGGSGHAQVRNAVVVSEVAISLMLLVGAGLLMRSFAALRAVHLGLKPDHVLVIRLPLPQDRYKTAAQVEGFFRPLLERLRNLPGVVDATETSALPPYGGLPSEIEIPGKTHSEKWLSAYQLCSDGYFSTLRIAFAEGRGFTEAEVNAARKVAVVNQTFARKFLVGSEPIGQRFRLLDAETLPDPVKDAWFEVIGVVADVKNQGLQNPITPEAWVPYTITGSYFRGVLIRTAQEPMTMLKPVQSEIWATDPGVALTLKGTLEGYIDSFSYSQPRFGFLLMGIFAGAGLVLVAIGVYSVLSYTTARRTHEIGIRMALGAQPGDVLRLVLGHGGKLALAGIVIGLAASLALTRLMSSILFGVKASDPETFVAVAALLLGVTLAACYFPARRAMRVDPIKALRYE
ncbi:MAG: ABC transporter permease [Candidatus Acidiferrales bacterium]